MMNDGASPMQQAAAQTVADVAPPSPQAPGLTPGPPPTQAPPGTTQPATVPPINAGLQARARVKVSMVMSMLTQALGEVGAETEDGQGIIEALRTLGKRFGAASPALGQQEAKMIVDSASPISTPTPQQGSAFQEAMRSRAAGLLGPGPGAV